MTTTDQPLGYFPLTKRKPTGSHYTPTLLAEFVAKQITELWVKSSGLQKVRVLDPAVGDGTLLSSLVHRILERTDCIVHAAGFDTDRNALDYSANLLKTLTDRVTWHLELDDFLEVAMTYGNSDLFPPTRDLFDMIIANPPYVRTQVMGATKAQLIARRFGLSGRVDLYYAFILAIARVLRPGGIAGIIVSNRFMTTKSGSDVRAHILEQFEVLHVWDLGDTKLFEAAVLPAVLLLKRKPNNLVPSVSRFTSIFSTNHVPASKQCPNAIEALDQNDVVQLPNGTCYRVQQGTLSHGENVHGVWHIQTDESSTWLRTVSENTFATFGTQFHIRVGVKTTVDPVFIRSDWYEMPENERPELLRPLITHESARRFKGREPKRPKQILYTHTVIDGKRVPVDLADFPRSAVYLNRHRTKLERRDYVRQASREWFEIWVPHDPNVWTQPKIVFRDIVEHPTFWLDLTGAIVNGDCYWLVPKCILSEDWLWLALAVGNSSFITEFYDMRFRHRLYASRRRFMTQYVEQFPLPSIHTPTSQRLINLAKEIYEQIPFFNTQHLEETLDNLVWQSFNLTPQRNH